MKRVYDSGAFIQAQTPGGPPPGAYTAIVSGVGGTTGVALVEAYRLGPP